MWYFKMHLTAPSSWRRGTIGRAEWMLGICSFLLAFFALAKRLPETASISICVFLGIAFLANALKIVQGAGFIWRFAGSSLDRSTSRTLLLRTSFLLILGLWVEACLLALV